MTAVSVDEMTAYELAEIQRKAEMWDEFVSSEKRFRETEAARGVDPRFDSQQLQASLPLGWRLVHFDLGSGSKKEWYSASCDAAGAMQSAASQALLIHRCEAWDSERARRNGEQDPKDLRDEIDAKIKARTASTVSA